MVSEDIVPSTDSLEHIYERWKMLVQRLEYIFFLYRGDYRQLIYILQECLEIKMMLFLLQPFSDTVPAIPFDKS